MEDQIKANKSAKSTGSQGGDANGMIVKLKRSFTFVFPLPPAHFSEEDPPI